MLVPILADASTTDPVASLLTQGGVLGVVIAGLVAAGKWVYNRLVEAHTRELAAKDAEIDALRTEIVALRAGLDSANIFVRDEVVPALVRSTETNREYVASLNRRAGAA